MDIQSRSLECFVVLADELHFRRAAQRLSLSQPALSMRIKSLEKYVGTPLFARYPRQVTLTAAGEAFLGPAQAAITNIGLARHSARACMSAEDVGIDGYQR